MLLLTPHATSERAVKGERPAVPQRGTWLRGGAVTPARVPGPAWARRGGPAVGSGALHVRAGLPCPQAGTGGQLGTVRRRGMPARAREYPGSAVLERGMELGAGGPVRAAGPLVEAVAGACGPGASRPDALLGACARLTAGTANSGPSAPWLCGAFPLPAQGRAL